MTAAVLDRPGAKLVRFRAMSTDVEVLMVGADDALARWARGRVEALEQRWSRFRPDSEISALNRAGGRPVGVSLETVQAIRAACAAWVFTRGAFDPTVHDSLLRLGYDDSIDVVRGREPARADLSPLPAPGCAGIVLDETELLVQLPPDVRLDLGGIGKGLAADDVATGLVARGALGAFVNIGGDVRVTGSPATSPSWHVQLEDPLTAQTAAVVELTDGGVATSTTLRRRWRSAAGSERHHLLDPQRGASTPEVGAAIVGASVVAGTAGWADALSKVPFVLGRVPAELFEAASTLVVRSDGSYATTGPLRFAMGATA
ncbi:MAG: FAD:protein FMN transferase [Actinobacteria bacterium]|nr:FAD:protein FMN transferase [Actinomycetota bacterium]